MGFLDQVYGSIIGPVANRAINVSGQHKDLFCKRDNQITDHVSISHYDSLKEPKGAIGKGFLRTAGAITDFNPVFNIALGRPYKCTKCNRVRFE
jgi:hypothetical protein